MGKHEPWVTHPARGVARVHRLTFSRSRRWIRSGMEIWTPVVSTVPANLANGHCWSSLPLDQTRKSRGRTDLYDQLLRPHCSTRCRHAEPVGSGAISTGTALSTSTQQPAPPLRRSLGRRLSHRQPGSCRGLVRRSPSRHETDHPKVAPAKSTLEYPDLYLRRVSAHRLERSRPVRQHRTTTAPRPRVVGFRCRCGRNLTSDRRSSLARDHLPNPPRPTPSQPGATLD